MIDLHCHILPAIDDGPLNIAEAYEMACIYSQHGFHSIAASPHYGEGPGGDASINQAQRAREQFLQVLKARQITLAILPNAEHYLTPVVFKRICQGQHTVIGGQGQWLLIELPWIESPNISAQLFQLRQRGFRLLLAHPERYDYLDIEMMRWLVRRDIKIQISLGSILGLFGSKPAYNAFRLIEEHLVHILATDFHKPYQADEWLQTSADLLKERFSPALWKKGFQTNPQRILANALVDSISPLEGTT